MITLDSNDSPQNLDQLLNHRQISNNLYDYLKNEFFQKPLLQIKYLENIEEITEHANLLVEMKQTKIELGSEKYILFECKPDKMYFMVHKSVANKMCDILFGYHENINVSRLTHRINHI
jgi:hypothetical protein